MNQKIRDYLNRNGSIDDLEAAVNFGCLSLSQEISRLRKTGMRLKQSLVTRRVRTRDGVIEKSVSRYRLVDDLTVSCIGLDRMWFYVGEVGFNIKATLSMPVPDLVRRLREVADKLEELNNEER